MSVFTLYIRSFHSQANFGLGGLFCNGDNRPFSTNPKVTSRIAYICKINLHSDTAKGNVDSSPSSHPLGMYQDYSKKETKPKIKKEIISITPYRPDGDQAVNIDMSYGGQNFAMPGYGIIGFMDKAYAFVVPSLDVNARISIRIDRDNKLFLVSSHLTGDGFPDCECFIIDEAQKAVFLNSHIRSGSAVGQLPFNGQIAMGATKAAVDWAGDDKFSENIKCEFCLDYTTGWAATDLRSKMPGNPCGIRAWNGVHEARDTATAARIILDNALGARRVFGRDPENMPK